MAHARTDETLLAVCVDAIDHHAQILGAELRSSLWTLAAQDQGARARKAIRTQDWAEAKEALDEVLSLILGGYGPRVLPTDTDVWARVCEGVLHDTPETWPEKVHHGGRPYWRTGKLGNDSARGLPAAEYEADDAARVWRLATGEVTRE